MQMESLAVRERILGRHNQEVPHPIIFRGAVFADQHRFDLCIQLWMYAVQLRQENQVPVSKDILRLAQVGYISQYQQQSFIDLSGSESLFFESSDSVFLSGVFANAAARGRFGLHGSRASFEGSDS